MKKMQVTNSRGPSLTPKVGDIVLFQLKGKNNMSRFVRVTEVLKHAFTFKTRKWQSIKKPIRLTTIV